MSDDLEDHWNPAQHLHDTLVRAKLSSRNAKNQHLPIRQVWATAFDLPTEGMREIFRRLNALSQVLDWTESEILTSPTIKRKSTLLRNFSSVSAALNYPNLESNWGPIDNLLTEQAITDLLHCAERLSEVQGEGRLTSEELIILQSQLSELEQTIHAGDFNRELKVALLDVILTAKELLSEYQIRGNKALRDIIELCLGKLATKQKMFSQQPESHKHLIKSVVTWLLMLDKAYDKVTKYGPLLQQFGGLFLPE